MTIAGAAAAGPGSAERRSRALSRAGVQTCDVLIVGASLGGVAAAMRAGSHGANVILVESGAWIGGQLTYQGVSTPDENHWTTPAGSTGSYQRFCARVREYYKSHYRLSSRGLSEHPFNPGNCWVSRLAMEPRAAVAVLHSILEETPNVTLHLHTHVTRVDVRDDRIKAVHALGPDGEAITYRAAVVLDATDLGDLLPMAGVEHVLGAESHGETGEPDAPDVPHPEWVQSFTMVFAIERRPTGENHTIKPPHDYEELKALQRYDLHDGGIKGMFGPHSWWTYRRIIDASNFCDPAFPHDVALVNCAANDFKGGIIPTGSAQADADTIAKARRASLGYLYWLQTECPRADIPGRRGYPELRLRPDIFGTPDGTAPRPYVRESRRIRAVKTVIEQEIVRVDFHHGKWQRGARAAFFPDSCGIGYYLVDVHGSPNHPHGLFLPSRPFQIPFGALIPIRVQNLLAASKNIGTTHITNGVFRLQPTEWNIGESAGALAAFCAERKITPFEVHEDAGLRRTYQRRLVKSGIPIYWWTDLPAVHPTFHSAQILAIERIWPDNNRLDFRPEERLSESDRLLVERAVGHGLPWPSADITRAHAADWLLSKLG
jgi:hypothetical protein